MALGQLGRVDDAWGACDELRSAIERAGATGSRFAAMELNVRAWLLRGTGRFDEADELNRAAIERNGAVDGPGPSSDSFAEGYWVAWLDLADGGLARGDDAGAAALVSSIEAMDRWQGTMAWHQRHRLGLLRARLAGADGDRSTAMALASSVATDAEARGSARYAALGQAHHVLAGGDADVDRVAATVDVLRRCAALELPAVLEPLGRQLGVDAWVREAHERRAALSSGR
jgi:hypothetical protein